jgi:MFS family permease
MNRMRRLLVLASVVVFLDVAFFAAITPLLPGYVEELGLSKAAAGVLSAAFAAGTLIASLPAGLMAARVGPRPTLLAGLALLGVSCVVFGFADTAVVLDTARFAQGVASALAWSGALTWVILAAPRSRRGSVIGNVIGVAVAGALFGPALGALAEGVGTEAVFSGVAAVTAALAVAALRMPDPPRDERETVALRTTLLDPAVLRSTWFVAAPAIVFGAVAVLVPLRIDELGGGAALIAAGFIAGAALEALTAPLVGRLSDRVGRLRPYVAGMAVCGVGIALLPLADVLGLVVADLVAISIGAGLCFTPAMTMLSDSASATGLPQGLAAGLINAAWAAGQVSGGAAGGASAEAAGDALPCLVAAAITALTAAFAWRAGASTHAAPATAHSGPATAD